MTQESFVLLASAWSAAQTESFVSECYDRDALLEVWLGYAGQWFDLRASLILGRDVMHLHRAAHGDEAFDAPELLNAPVQTESTPLMALVVEEAKPVVGSAAQLGVEDLYSVLGVPAPEPLVCVPLRLGGRVAMLLIGAPQERIRAHRAAPDEFEPLLLMTQAVASQLRQIIKRHRDGSLPPAEARIPAPPVLAEAPADVPMLEAPTQLHSQTVPALDPSEATLRAAGRLPALEAASAGAESSDALDDSGLAAVDRQGWGDEEMMSAVSEVLEKEPEDDARVAELRAPTSESMRETAPPSIHLRTTRPIPSPFAAAPMPAESGEMSSPSLGRMEDASRQTQRIERGSLPSFTSQERAVVRGEVGDEGSAGEEQGQVPRLGIFKRPRLPALTPIKPMTGSSEASSSDEGVAIIAPMDVQDSHGVSHTLMGGFSVEDIQRERAAELARQAQPTLQGLSSANLPFPPAPEPSEAAIEAEAADEAALPELEPAPISAPAEEEALPEVALEPELEQAPAAEPELPEVAVEVAPEPVKPQLPLGAGIVRRRAATAEHRALARAREEAEQHDSPEDEAGAAPGEPPHIDEDEDLFSEMGLDDAPETPASAQPLADAPEEQPLADAPDPDELPEVAVAQPLADASDPDEQAAPLPEVEVEADVEAAPEVMVEAAVEAELPSLQLEAIEPVSEEALPEIAVEAEAPRAYSVLDRPLPPATPESERLAQLILGRDRQMAFQAAAVAPQHPGVLHHLRQGFPGMLLVDRQGYSPERLPAVGQHSAVLSAMVALSELSYPLLPELLESNDPDVRFYAVHLLTELSPLPLLDRLVPRLSDRDPWIRNLARHVVMLTLSRTPASRAPFAAVLRHTFATQHEGNDLLTEVIAKLLGELEDVASIPTLFEALDRHYGPSHEAIGHALQQITFQGLPASTIAWRKWWEHGQHETRREWFVHAVNAPSADARKLAAKAMSELPGFFVDYRHDYKPALRLQAQAQLKQWLAAHPEWR